MTASNAEQFLYKLPRFARVGIQAYKPGLERMATLMQAMGRPDQAYPTVHIAGTNGKGTTASFLAAIATATGIKAGLHTSPHLIRVAERMRINGMPAPGAWLSRAVDEHADLISATGASFFEALVALTLLYFAEESVDFAVIEVGLGGRLDATNILQPELSVITNISWDHEEILGDSLESIAAEKAGIIKPGVPVLTGADQSEVLDVFRRAARRKESRLHILSEEVGLEEHTDQRISIQTPEKSYASIAVEMIGVHQHRNAALAVRAAELSQSLNSDSGDIVKDGIERVAELSGIRARIETIWRDPRIVLDVAHNDDALSATLDTCISRFGGIDHVFLGLMKDKKIDSFAVMLSELKIPVSVLGIDSERAFDRRGLTTLLKNRGVRVMDDEMSASVALNAARSSFTRTSTLLILGSYQIAGSVLESLERQQSEMKE